MNNAFSLLTTLQVGGLFFGVPMIYDRDCSLLRSRSVSVVTQSSCYDTKNGCVGD